MRVSGGVAFPAGYLSYPGYVWSFPMRRGVWLILGLALATGCDLIPDDTESGSSELKQFSSEKEFADYFAAQVVARNGQVTSVDRAALEEGGGEGANDSAQAPSAAPGDAGATADSDGGDGFSGTTLQEEGVDESDVVKTDGNFVYLIHGAGNGSMLRIVDVSSRSAMRVVGEVELDGWGSDLYLHGDKVVALTSAGGGFIYFGGGIADVAPATTDIALVTEEGAGQDVSSEGGAPSDGAVSTDDVLMTTDADGAADEPVSDDAVTSEPSILPYYEFERPRTVVTVIDVSDRSAPRILSETRFEGSQAASRMIDGVLHLVVANYQNYFIDIMPRLGMSDFDAGEVDPLSSLPRYERVNADGSTTSGDVLTWESLYRPSDPDGFGVLYVASVDVDADAAFTAVGIVAEPGMIYSSRNALYVTDTNYNFDGETRTDTDIYKLAYEGRGSRPVATGTIPGRLLNQYSMGEHNGFLRAASTVDATFGFAGPISESSNNVYVLQQDGGALSIAGRVENIAPGETIQSARFIGNRGYVVTFEQIDPLFTLDLADPANPRIVGELKVPGFSTFIVPMDDTHLLTVGQYIPDDDGTFRPWAVQLSIFDVSDFANPSLMDSAVIGEETGAYSEALWNPKAFTYYADRGVVGLPVSIYGTWLTTTDPGLPEEDRDNATSGGGSSGSDAAPPSDAVIDEGGSVDAATGWQFPEDSFDGLVVLSVSAETGFSELGRVSARFEKQGSWYWPSYTRGVFLGDDVLAVTDQGLRGAPVSEVEPAMYELSFEPIDYPWDEPAEGDVESDGGTEPDSGASPEEEASAGSPGGAVR